MHGILGHRGRGGFTLVELLVVLVILASLVTVTTVSVESTQDKARADKTASIGRGVIEDLERTDHLSFVSDFGRLPETADEVKFLFSQTIADADLVEHTAAECQFQTLAWPSSLPSGAPFGSDAKLAKAFGEPVLGVGWRGPYSLITELHQEAGAPPAFMDAWKNEWEVLTDGARFSGLRSTGRDGLAGGTDWQDIDLDFALRRSPIDADLQGQVLVRAADGTEYSTEGQFTSLTLRILYFTPDFTTNLVESPATGNVAAVEFTWNGTSWDNPTRPEQASANPFQFRLSGLTAGHRVVFIYMFGTPTGGAEALLYGGGARLVHVQPGTNRMEFRLTEL